jgi:hypothetical protein
MGSIEIAARCDTPMQTMKWQQHHSLLPLLSIKTIDFRSTNASLWVTAGYSTWRNHLSQEESAVTPPPTQILWPDNVMGASLLPGASPRRAQNPMPIIQLSFFRLTKVENLWHRWHMATPFMLGLLPHWRLSRLIKVLSRLNGPFSFVARVHLWDLHPGQTKVCPSLIKVLA